jgi:hypothetical protein
MVSPLNGVIVATPVPIAEKVKPVPAMTVAAAGRVIVDEPLPTKNTMQPDELAGMVAFELNTMLKETEMPLPTAQAVAPYFAMIAPELAE